MKSFIERLKLSKRVEEHFIHNLFTLCVPTQLSLGVEKCPTAFSLKGTVTVLITRMGLSG